MAYSIDSTRKAVTLEGTAAPSSPGSAPEGSPAGGPRTENFYLSALAEAMEAFAERPGLLQSLKGMDGEDVTRFFAHIQPQTEMVREGIPGIRYETAQKMVIRMMAEAWRRDGPIESVGDKLVRFSQALGDTHFDPDEIRLDMLADPEKTAQDMTDWTRMVMGISPNCFDEKTHQPVTPEISAFLSDMLRYGVRPEPTGKSIRLAEDYMTPTADGVFQWKEVAFLDPKIQYGIRFALAFQAARAINDFMDGLERAEREGRQKGFLHATKNVDRVVRNALQASIACANSVEDCPVPPTDQQDYFFRVCTAMREGMDSWHLYMNTLYKNVPRDPRDTDTYLSTQAKSLLDRARDRKDFLLSSLREALPGQNVSALILTRASLMEGLRPLWRLPQEHPVKRAMLGSLDDKSAIVSLESGIRVLADQLAESNDRISASNAYRLVRKIASGALTGQVKWLQSQIKSGVSVESGELLRNVETSLRNGTRMALNLGDLMTPQVKTTLAQWTLPRIEWTESTDRASERASTASLSSSEATPPPR